ncbi:MAG: hypothetical protein ABIG11_07360 [bacterium]
MNPLLLSAAILCMLHAAALSAKEPPLVEITKASASVYFSTDSVAGDISGEAVSRARKSAVEKSVGYACGGRRDLLKKNPYVRKLLENHDKYIKSYTIEEEKKTSGTYSVRIQAVVDSDLLLSDLRALGFGSRCEHLETFVGLFFQATPLSENGRSAVTARGTAAGKAFSLALPGFGARYVLNSGIFAEGSGYFLTGTSKAGTLTDSKGTRELELSAFAPLSFLAGMDFGLWKRSRLRLSAGKGVTFVRIKVGGERFPSEYAWFSPWIAKAELLYPIFDRLGAGVSAEYRSKSSFYLLGSRNIKPVSFGVSLAGSF